jgi:hypothetical protein
MKKLLCVAICAISVIAAQAGSISGLNSGAAVTGIDGTPLGSSAMGQFYIGADANSLAPVGSPVNFLAAGLLNAGTLTANGTVALQLKAWTGGTSFDNATARGESNIITITATDPPATPAGLAANGLTGFQLQAVGGPVIPEPSTIALGLLGAAALFLRRRK